uniref:Uncharacterized protein n=1 Tax=Scophthalmus maximus TaxID=52904 RepID=A0A8D3BWV1_SCOMX
MLLCRHSNIKLCQQCGLLFVSSVIIISRLFSAAVLLHTGLFFLFSYFPIFLFFVLIMWSYAAFVSARGSVLRALCQFVNALISRCFSTVSSEIIGIKRPPKAGVKQVAYEATPLQTGERSLLIGHMHRHRYVGLCCGLVRGLDVLEPRLPWLSSSVCVHPCSSATFLCYPLRMLVSFYLSLPLCLLIFPSLFFQLIHAPKSSECV